jgi:Fe-S oxidoreductase
MHRPRSQVAEELAACIRCNECLEACPALPVPITIKTLNNETLDGPISADVARFAQACFQCGACVPVCPVGLHRDALMLWLKMRLLRGDFLVPESAERSAVPLPRTIADTTSIAGATGEQALPATPTPRSLRSYAPEGTPWRRERSW